MTGRPLHPRSPAPGREKPPAPRVWVEGAGREAGMGWTAMGGSDQTGQGATEELVGFLHLIRVASRSAARMGLER